jgi:hypothetical protein
MDPQHMMMEGFPPEAIDRLVHQGFFDAFPDDFDDDDLD